MDLAWMGVMVENPISERAVVVGGERERVENGGRSESDDGKASACREVEASSCAVISICFLWPCTDSQKKKLRIPTMSSLRCRSAYIFSGSGSNSSISQC